jgi:hypothetical protein
MGDGVLLEFPSVVAAVECAIAIQKMMAERNATVPEAKRILYRVGVNLGDILIDGEDILGDGVNVVARLEGICEPGGVCVSSSAYEQVRGLIEAEFVDLGEQALKNIARPVRTYALSPAAIAAAKVEPAALTNPSPAPERREPPRLPEPSSPEKRAALTPLAAAVAALLVVIAGGAWWLLNTNRPARLSMVVLPFANLSGDPGQDYLVDALTDGLTTALARLAHLRDGFVIARNTAMTFKGKAVDAKAIGRDLGVRYVLEGSVQPSGDLPEDDRCARPHESQLDQQPGVGTPAAGGKTKSAKANQHHRPCGRLRNGDSPEQAVRLAVDAVGEVQSAGVSVAASAAERQRPKAACRIA